MTRARHIIGKLLKLKIKEKVLKAGRGKRHITTIGIKTLLWNGSGHNTMEQHI